jgi:hypothetical protein
MQLPYKQFVIWGQNEQEIGILYYSSATKHESGFLIQGFCISEYVWYQSRHARTRKHIKFEWITLKLLD